MAVNITKKPQIVFNRSLKFSQKSNSAIFKETKPYMTLYDLPLMNIVNRLKGIKKTFKNIAFIGPNPYLFIQHLPKEYEIENLYFCEGSQECVEKSYEIITRKIDSGFYEKVGTNLPNQIIPKVIDEEQDWQKEFKTDQLDLIVNNMSLHWVNDLDKTLNSFRETMIPDGVFIGSVIGGNALQELRICLNLAESERDGGVSTITSPLLSIQDIGNIFAKAKFNLPTIDISHIQYEFTSTFQLFDYLKKTGEQNALLSKRNFISEETFIAAAAIYETLFNKRTIGRRDENSTSILVDTLQNDLLDERIGKPIVDGSGKVSKNDKMRNIMTTLDVIYLIGWKQHESQQKPKERGTAKFSLKDVVKEMNDKEGDEKNKIKYGMLIDTGDEVKEIDK
ncbi:UNKNOWN [Stylonychia lemnae]|uniref:Methyltransferase type 11 domain-containing protein n=1 Tax=Stylonychia lemnae TaxID=5949 RepID=A0A078AB70_STYLE|nr:UNKNOWN [Stylonychia lemnae]|eukprot:CDW79540.1 UNKNOWN [Stylonychia lemnae]